MFFSYMIFFASWFFDFKLILIFLIEIVCRYLRQELVVKGAIFEQNLPQYLAAWVDKSNDLCIFKACNMQTWLFTILQSCPWFLECSLTFCTAKEEKERNSIGDDVFLSKLIPSEVISNEVPKFSGKRNYVSKMTVTPSQKTMVSRTCGPYEHASLRTYANDDHMDLIQHDGCVQMTGIFTKEVLS